MSYLVGLQIQAPNTKYFGAAIIWSLISATLYMGRGRTVLPPNNYWSTIEFVMVAEAVAIESQQQHFKHMSHLTLMVYIYW